VKLSLVKFIGKLVKVIFNYEVTHTIHDYLGGDLMRMLFGMVVSIVFSSLVILPNHLEAEGTDDNKYIQLAPANQIDIYERQILNSPIKYPQIKGLENVTAEQKINLTLRAGAEVANKHRLKLLADEKEAKAKWNSSQGPWRPYEYVFTYKIPFSDQNHLSVIYNEYFYTGGAHGISIGTTYNFNTKTGELIPLSKIIDGKTKVIQDYVFQQLQKQYSGYILIKSPNEIELNDKVRLWVFEKDGIKLIFKEYEVAAYAAGMPEVFVPYQVFK
jgi:Deacetylase PdaC/Protein of unknown function (DUF3298)